MMYKLIRRTIPASIPIFLFSLHMILAPFGGGAPCAAGADAFALTDIQILESGNGTVTLDLVTEEAGGFICTGCDDLVRMQVDGSEIPHDIHAAGDGKADVTAPFTGLEDGRHKATAESLDAGGGVLSAREALFIIDSLPPELELLAPQKPRIQPTQTSFLVRCRDEGAGISPDPQASGLSVTIDGNEAAWQITEESGDLILIIAANVAQWEPDRTVALRVQIQDRAGNPAEMNRSFTVESPEELWDLETIDCVPGDSQKQGLYVLRRIPFPLRTSVHWIRFDKAHRSVTLSLDLSPFENGSPLDSEIYRALEVVSEHPCVRVERLPRPTGASSLSFLVRQVSCPDDGGCLGAVRIRYPEFVVFDWELSCRGTEPQGQIQEMHTEGAQLSYTIPVSLHTKMNYAEEVRVEEDLLLYRFLLTGAASLDTATSWFDMEGTRSWLNRAGQGAYEASIPVCEGLHVYTTNLALSLWGWGSVSQGEVSPDGRTLRKTGEVFVTLEPPQIEHFHYDRQDECFRAMISDRGTALEDLVVRLSVSGTEGQDSGYDPAAGAVMSPFPLPGGIQAARLEVTDLAGQTTTASCRVFGTTPDSHPVESPDPVYSATVKEGGDSRARKPARSPSNGRVYRQYHGTYKGGREAVTECIGTTVPVTKEHPLMSCLNAAWARYGTASISPGTPGSSLKMTGSPLPASNPALTRAEEACKRRYPPGSQYHWTLEKTEECWSTWIDTLAPRIRDVAYLPAQRQITAFIDDHGMPLSQVRIDYRIEPEPLTRPYDRTGFPFTYDTGTGLFLGQAALRSGGEIFKAEIEATDAAGNWSRKWLDVTAPLRPPDVSLDVLERGGVSYPMGSCFDPSGVDHRKTRAWVDEQRVIPLGIRYGNGSSPDRVDFGPVTDEGPHMVRLAVSDFAGLSSEASAAFQVALSPEIENFRHLPTSLQNAGGPAFSATIRDRGNDLDLRGIDLIVDGDSVDTGRLYYEPRSGYFAADGPMNLSPGLHHARLTATDAHGHSDEALLDFVPGERIRVTDPEPRSLSIEEVTLWELEDHNGDGKANPGETVRLFVSLAKNGAGRLESLSGRLESGEDDIVVETDRVTYGDVSQGEIVSPMHGFDIRIDEAFLDTRPSDPYEARFTLEAAAGEDRMWRLDFEVPVYRPTLPFAVNAPNQPRVAAAPADPADPGNPNPPDPMISEVTVALDPLPPNTEDEEIEIKGTATCTASTIEEVIVRVNGTAHAAAWNAGDGTFTVTAHLDVGDNLIEAEAVDRTGAVGMDTGFVHRSEPYVPPEIEITEPPQGGGYMCSDVFLRGNFDAGSSKVSSFQGSMTAEGETVSLPMGYSSGEGAFWVGAEEAESLLGHFRPGWGNNHVTSITVTIILTTTDGDTVQDTVTFTYVCWS